MAREGEGERGRDGGGSGVWEYERGTAGLLLSGLESLGAPASKQSQLCFQEDRLQVDMTVPLCISSLRSFRERSAY